MKIAIAGPGRSGTSLLVSLFREWGFSVPETGWNERAQAGLENRIGSGSDVEVEKDPWAFEYLHNVNLDDYDAFIIPIRSRRNAVSSRIVQERFFRALTYPGDNWAWKSSGDIPGGAVSDISEKGISQVLSEGLWDLFFTLSEKQVNPVLLSFPRFARDFDYLWEQLGPIIRKRMSKKKAMNVWNRVVRSDLLHDDQILQVPIEVEELLAIVEKLRAEVRQLREGRPDSGLE